MRLPRRPQLPLSLALLATLALAPATVLAGPAVSVTTCGQTVPKRGVLTADLDCSAFDGAAVVLAKNARLDLGGFTITAKDNGVSCGVGTCQVRGPGAIRRPAYDSGLNFSEVGYGIRSSGNARVRDVAFEHWNHGVFAIDRNVVRDCTLVDGGWGVVGGPVKVAGSTITGNEHAGVRCFEGTKDGIHYLFFSCNVHDSSLSGNTIDIESYRRPVVKGSTCTTTDQLTVPSTPYGGGDEWGVCS